VFGNTKDRIDDLEREVRLLKSALADAQSERQMEIHVLRSQLIRVMQGKSINEEVIRTGMPFEEIDAAEAVDHIKENPTAFVLDVRTNAEWLGGHIDGATLISVDELEGRLHEIPEDKSRSIICICAMGGRSAAACGILAEAGYTHLTNINGGMNGYTGETVTGP
jgi:rhodanese-related sulfurtransferase